MPIKPLTRIVCERFEDGREITRLPNNEEMVKKINEIVRLVNKSERDKEDQKLDELFKIRTTY